MSKYKTGDIVYYWSENSILKRQGISKAEILFVLGKLLYLRPLSILIPEQPFTRWKSEVFYDQKEAIKHFIAALEEHIKNLEITLEYIERPND